MDALRPPATASLADDVFAFLIDEHRRSDPYPLFSRLQRNDPVHRAITGSWVVTRFDDVVAVLEDDRFALGLTGERPAKLLAKSDVVEEYLRSMMSMRDPPDHDRLHQIVRRQFSLQAALRFRRRIEEIVDELIDPLVEAGQAEVISDLGSVLPVNVSCAILKIPREEWERVRSWTELLTRQILNWAQSDADTRTAEASAEEFSRYLREVIGARRSDRSADDVVSTLTDAHDRGDLSSVELVAYCMLLLMSGRETATHMIGNGVATLIRHPRSLQRLRRDPSVVPSALDECLRFESPVRLAARVAGVDIDVGGKTVHKGEVVMAVLAAANRDPSRFAEPDRFDVFRRPNPHIAFGRGRHFCLGHAYARLEGEIVLDRLFARGSVDIELHVREAELPWSDSLPFRGLRSLPIKLSLRPGRRQG